MSLVRLPVWLGAALLLALAPAAQAQTAREAFAAGRFAEAAALGQESAAAADLVAGGRALVVQGSYEATAAAEARRLLQAAEALFDRALAAQPGDPDARLQRAVTRGYRAKLDRSPALARDARREMEALVAQRPRDPLVLATLGGWHLEAVNELGPLAAGASLGARRAEGERLFARAEALAPAGPAVWTFHAFALLGRGEDRAGEARPLLERAVAAEPADGFDRLLIARAREVLALIQRGDTAGARRAARRLSPLGRL